MLEPAAERTATREERVADALRVSRQYTALTTAACLHQLSLGSQLPPADTPDTHDIETFIAAVQYQFLGKNYRQIITRTHRYLHLNYPELLIINTSHQPDHEHELALHIKNIKAAYKKVPILLESVLICFKKLSSLPPTETTTETTTETARKRDPVDMSLLPIFLDISIPFCTSLPSLGIPASYLLTKLNRPNEALKVIIPALIHSSSPRILQLIKHAIATSDDPRASARILVNQVLTEHPAHLKAVIQHLGLSNYHITIQPPATTTTATATTSTDKNWSSYIYQALLEMNQTTDI